MDLLEQTDQKHQKSEPVATEEYVYLFCPPHAPFCTILVYDTSMLQNYEYTKYGGLTTVVLWLYGGSPPGASTSAGVFVSASTAPTEVVEEHVVEVRRGRVCREG